MSDSVRPHRRQPTRLCHPWDSPGKNTGVGCHFLLQCMKVKSEREVAQSCLTLRDPMDCSLPGSSVHGIFQARGLEWGAIAFSICRGDAEVKWVNACEALSQCFAPRQCSLRLAIVTFHYRHCIFISTSSIWSFSIPLFLSSSCLCFPPNSSAYREHCSCLKPLSASSILFIISKSVSSHWFFFPSHGSYFPALLHTW